MSDAPERIWACVSKNTKSGVVTLLGDATFPVDGWQEYVRADRIEALTKERDALRSALGRIRPVPERILRGIPVRDLAETLAEADSALSKGA